MEPSRRGFGLAFVGSARNLTLVAMPPVSLAVLALTSLHGVALFMTGMVLLGLLLVWIVPFRFRPSTGNMRAPLPADRRTWHGDDSGSRFGVRARTPSRSTCCSSRTGGSSIAYLPQRAEAAGADIGLFFVADGIAILLSRVPAGWLADRIRPVILYLLVGISMTAVMVVLRPCPLTTPLLVIAGVLSGAGSGLVMTPASVPSSKAQWRRRPGQRLLPVLGGPGRGVGRRHIGGAPLVAAFGFEVAILATLGGIAGAAALTLWRIAGSVPNQCVGLSALSRQCRSGCPVRVEAIHDRHERKMIQAGQAGEIDLLRDRLLARPAQQVPLAGRIPRSRTTASCSAV